ncbi:hypothetical protein Tco_0945441, partial [Tanacetum coccineum]
INLLLLGKVNAARHKLIAADSKLMLLAQAQEISILKLRVKRLEKKGGLRTHKLKRLFNVGRSAQVASSEDEGLGDQEDASKQGRKIDDIDQDAKLDVESKLEASICEGEKLRYNCGQLGIADKTRYKLKTINLAQALAELRSAKPKVVVQEPLQKADRLLAERLQAREQEELTDEEKERLFVELLEKRKKHFATLRAQEKRNKPPTKA